MSDEKEREKQKRKGLPDSSLADPVTHAEMQAELTRLRSAVTLLANCLGANVIGQHDARRLMDLLAPPYERS